MCCPPSAFILGSYHQSGGISARSKELHAPCTTQVILILSFLHHSNNRSLDIFGLYREVIQVGGLITNEAYDETGRWVGQVNFAGHVFPKMLNYTKDHRATSVGNQLLTNYRKYLYDYERAWRHIDLPRCYQINTEGIQKHPKRVRKGSTNHTKDVSSPSGKCGTPSDALNAVDAATPASRDFETAGKRQQGKNAKHKHSPVSDARNVGGVPEAVTPDQTQNNSVVQGGSDESEKQRDRSGVRGSIGGFSSRNCRDLKQGNPVQPAYLSYCNELMIDAEFVFNVQH